MPFDKSLYPSCDTEGPLGIPMPDAVAKYVQGELDKHKDTRDKEMVKLAGAAEVEIDSERTEISKITTEAVDRDREVVIAKGGDLKAFQDNPVVLLNHNWSGMPVGKSLWTKKTSEGGSPGIKAKTLYATRPAEAQGEWVPDSVLALVKQGAMRGKSIGFIPLERRSYEKTDNPAWKDARSIIPKWLMLEYSVTPIPSNPEALCETVWKSHPALAMVLGLAKPAEKKTLNPDEMTIEQLQAELAELKADREQWGPIAEQVKQLLDDSETLKRAVHRMRMDFIREPETPKQEAAPKMTDADLLAAFRKIVTAA